MKSLIRSLLFHAFALWLTTQIVPGITVGGGWQGILMTAVVLSLLMLLVKPLLKILFIPINFMTFGLLSWAVNVVVVYLLTFLAPGVHVNPWTYPGAEFSGFVIPPMQISYLLSLTLVTVSIALITNILDHVSQ